MTLKKKRRWYMEEVPPISQLEKKEVEKLVIDIVRYSKRLRFYDYVIGNKILGQRKNKEAEKAKLDDFIKGIDFILNLWKEYGHFDNSEKHVEIITTQLKNFFYNDTEEGRKRKIADNKCAYEEIQDKLISPLQNKYNWPIGLIISKTPPYEFRDRYLQTEYSIISVSKGFDLFYRNKLRHNVFRIENGASDHLRKLYESNKIQ